MDNLILHEATRHQVQQFIARPAHALLLTGPDGIGKTAIAEVLAAMLLQLDVAKLANHPYYKRIAPDGSSSTISIEAIRELQKFLQLKTTGRASLRRAILIEHAQGLTIEAQNAYLKLLEEPPADTLLLLTADSPRALLPTILSRVQTITIYPPTEAQLQPLLTASSADEATMRQILFLSGGLPGLLHALLDKTAEHPLLASVAQAKDILQKTPFERLSLVDSLSKQRETSLAVVAALERMAETALMQAAGRNDTGRIKQWHRIRKQTLAAREALEHSANAKLTLSNLFLHL